MASDDESDRVFLDAEALTAYARGARHFVPLAIASERLDAELHASALTLAEVTDGSGRDVVIRRVASAIEIHDTTAAIGFEAGRLRARTARGRRKARDLTVDAVVAASAVAARATVVLTSDLADLERLLEGMGVRVEPI